MMIFWIMLFALLAQMIWSRLFRPLITTLTVLKWLINYRQEYRDTRTTEADANVMVLRSPIEILIPLFREQDNVARLHDYLWSNCTMPDVPLRFHIVTTDRELNGGVVPTTDEVLRSYSWPSHVHLLHLEEKIEGKGAVLNAALEFLNVADESWVGIYDVDSAPEPQVFKYVSEYRGAARVIQQPCLYLLNENKLNGIYLCLALIQSAWCFGNECVKYRMLKKLHGQKGWWYRVPYLYPVSHGLFLRRKLIKDIGGFKHVYEDLRLGCPLMLQREIIDVAPYIDRCTFADNLKVWIRQSYSWANGSWLAVEDAPTSLRRLRCRTLAMITFRAKNVYSNIAWGVFGFVIPATVIIALFSTKFELAFTALLLWVLQALIIQRLLTKVFHRFSLQFNGSYGECHRFTFLACIIAPLLYCIGPMYAVIQCGIGRYSDPSIGVHRTQKASCR